MSADTFLSPAPPMRTDRIADIEALARMMMLDDEPHVVIDMTGVTEDEAGWLCQVLDHVAKTLGVTCRISLGLA